MKITAKIEQIDKKTAAKYLATMTLNRPPKEATIASYANDMINGKWLLSPQGLAFNEEGQLFDGQHRLMAIVRADIAVELLVLRGFPDKQNAMKTMDVMDAGIGRSLVDRLKLMGCYHGNPNLASAAARQIVAAIMGQARSARKPSLSIVMEILKLWKNELNAVCKVMDAPKFAHARNGHTVAAFTIAAVADVKRLDLDMGRFVTGGGLDADSALLELRNLFYRNELLPREKTRLCLSAIYCAWHGIPGRQFLKTEQQAKALEFFRASQAARFIKVETLFFTPLEAKH